MDSSKKAFTKPHLAQSVAPTYFIHRVTDYELTGGLDPAGKPYLRVKDFEVEAIPPFLEGAVRGMMISSREDIQVLHKKLRNSDLFDHKLGLFKVNAPLTSQSHEIGRIRAFTPGWLENESIWMHMAFKYLLELQKAGLYEDFFRELRNHLPAFMDSEVYGRSPLENSSFIVSSAHPDKSIHGTGFVARLSGSTAEFLSMWVNMTTVPRIKDEDRIFCLYSPDVLTKAIEAAAIKAGISDFRPHDLRHTFATSIRQQGAGLDVVQDLLGHSHPSQTRRYPLLGIDQLKEAAKSIEQIFAIEPSDPEGKGRVN